jgi:DNA-binding GntR family transcriptional regulator
LSPKKETTHNKRRSLRKNRTPPKTLLTERVFEALKRDIITGHFKPGEGLMETMLAKRYSTSRTPVRQAAARAEHENLLRSVPNKGYFVKPISIEELNELYQWRMIIEGACAELAAKKPQSPDALKRLEYYASVDYEGGNRSSYVRFIEADRAFHVGVAQLTRNRFLLQMVGEVRNWVDRLLHISIEADDHVVLLANHVEIFRAIEERNPQLARKRMVEHVLESKTKVFDLL